MSKWKIVWTNLNAISEINSSSSENPIRRLISSTRIGNGLKSFLSSERFAPASRARKRKVKKNENEFFQLTLS